MSDPTRLTPPPDEPMADHARARIRAELLEAAQRSRPARRWVAPGAVAAAVVLVVGLAAWAVQAGTGTRPDGAPPVAATSTSPPGSPAASPSESPSERPSEPPSTLPSRSPGRAGGHQTARSSCADEVADVLPGAREAASFGDGAGSWFTGFWVAGDRFVLCDVRADITTVQHPHPLEPAEQVSTYAVSSVYPSWPHSSAVIRVAGGVVPAGATAFDVSYTFPDGGTRHAQTTTDDQGRTWWRMLYVYEDGGGNELKLPPIRVQVSYSGVQKTYDLRWGLDTCAQANHGC